MRKGIFIDHLEFNEAHDPEVEGHTVSINEFSDYTPEEFSILSGTANPAVNKTRIQMLKNEELVMADLTTAINKAGWDSFDLLPKSFDWRDYGVVTAVRH
jgi:hypothetical protein